MNKKKIVFLTGTRADFGKLKSLITITQESEYLDVHIFATGMHMNALYGSTINEIRKSGFKNIHGYENHDENKYMDRILARTIDGFSHYIEKLKPDLIVIHGDRVETLAGAIVGSLNNILVAHIEGGEVSGSVDELIRHSVSKLSHIHLVTNLDAKNRLLQLGELDESIFVIGSPDLDLMDSKEISDLTTVMNYYDIGFSNFSIALFHPVTTEYKDIKKQAKNFVDSLIDSNLNYILIYPNNDLGSVEILKEYERLKSNNRIAIFQSLRFEYFLRLLKCSDFIIGNSSAGLREAPHYKVATIDIGTRQNKREELSSVIHCNYDKTNIISAINIVKSSQIYFEKNIDFGNGRSSDIFYGLLKNDDFWNINKQKIFQAI